MPTTVPLIYELRQRLAISFFFDDVQLATHDPSDAITIGRVLERLRDERFRVGQDSDYARLTAEMHLLNMALNEGVQTAADDGPEAEKEFNQEIDELVGRLKAIWGAINDTGMAYMSRTEAKSVVEWLQERLSYTVRTKTRPRKSIFDPDQRDDPFLPRQQDYMRRFVRKNEPGGIPAAER
jgi:hypothetical protein